MFENAPEWGLDREAVLKAVEESLTVLLAAAIGLAERDLATKVAAASPAERPRLASALAVMRQDILNVSDGDSVSIYQVAHDALRPDLARALQTAIDAAQTVAMERADG